MIAEDKVKKNCSYDIITTKYLHLTENRSQKRDQKKRDHGKLKIHEEEKRKREKLATPHNGYYMIHIYLEGTKLNTVILTTNSSDSSPSYPNWVTNLHLLGCNL